jgi:addiction module RelE/StbE family toxin
MSVYKLLYDNEALKDIKRLSPRRMGKFKQILEEVISTNPYLGKKLKGDMQKYYSYRLSLKDRILYRIDDKRKIIIILRARTHYGD